MLFIAERKPSERPVEVRLATMAKHGCMGLYFMNILVAMIHSGRIERMGFAGDSEDQCALRMAGIYFDSGDDEVSYVSFVNYEEPAG